MPGPMLSATGRYGQRSRQYLRQVPSRACMTEQAPETGWVVEVTIPAPPRLPNSGCRVHPGRDPPSFIYFNVAIADAVKAIAATVKHLAKSDETREMRVVRGLSVAEIAALSLTGGQVKPA